MAQKIILAEDDEILSRVLGEELEDAGYKVHKAHDGEKALKLTQAEHPDLLLLDLLMPKKHGFDVLAEIKQSPVTRDVPVIILTMLGQDEDIKKGLRLGATDYIVKSQHAASEIVDKIKEFFSKEAHPEKGERPKNIADEVADLKSAKEK